MESIEEYMVAIRKIDDYCDYLAKRGRKTNSIETMRYMLIGSIRRMNDKDQHTDPTKIRRKATPGDYFLFRMTKKEIIPFDDDKVNYIVSGISKRSKIDFTLHSLRRLFATTAVSCTDLYVVQTLMGHTSISTTERYVKRERSALMSAMEMISAKI